MVDVVCEHLEKHHLFLWSNFKFMIPNILTFKNGFWLWVSGHNIFGVFIEISWILWHSESMAVMIRKVYVWLMDLKLLSLRIEWQWNPWLVHSHISLPLVWCHHLRRINIWKIKLNWFNDWSNWINLINIPMVLWILHSVLKLVIVLVDSIWIHVLHILTGRIHFVLKTGKTLIRHIWYILLIHHVGIGTWNHLILKLIHLHQFGIIWDW